MTKQLSHRMVAIVLMLAFSASVALADDKSYSEVIKHIKTNYRGKKQSFFGMMLIARFAVKMIKPAGVKNFKVTMLRELDYSGGPAPESRDFRGFIRSKIDPGWMPLVEYSAPHEKQWTYVYSLQEKDDLKLLVVTVQKQDAFVLQAKFSPAKLVEFMNDPKIMGISLKDDNGQKPPPVNVTTDSDRDKLNTLNASLLAQLCTIGLH